MKSTGKTAFNIKMKGIVSGGKMKEIKSMLAAFAIALVMLTAISASQEPWNLGSSDDWLSTGPVEHVGPFYYPNRDLPIGTQQFLNSYPSYMPLGYPNYYQPYNPVVLGGIGNYMPVSYYMPGFNNPFYYDPQAELDLAAANHAYQKSLYNYYNRYYRGYPYWMGA